MEPIPEAIVDKTWQEVAGFSPDRAKKEMVKIGNSQPELLAFVTESAKEMGQDGRKEEMMKRKLLFLLMGTLILTFISNQVLAEGTHTISSHKFAVFENGKPTDVRIVAFITVKVYQGKPFAFWRDITISPDKETKKVVLNSDSHGTYNGSISNVRVGKDYFSFTIHTVSPRVGKRNINIVGKRIEGDRYEITGMGIWSSDIPKETIKTEYRTVDKIILPYNEVY